MEYFWKENKKFVIAVGGALLFVLLYNSFVLSPIRKAADVAASMRNQKKRDMERRLSQGVATDEALAAARADRNQNRKTLAGITPDIGFPLGERFQLRKNDKIIDLYDNLKLDLIKDLQKKATDGRVSFPKDVGLPDSASDETSVEVLSRLAVVERLATLAIDAEVEKIEVLDGQVGMDRVERGAKKSQFLSKYGAFIKVTGKQSTIFKIIHGVQKKGNYLAVTNFEIARPDATKDLFEASISVAMLKVDDKAGLESK